MTRFHATRNAFYEFLDLFLLVSLGTLLLFPSLNIYFVSDNIGHITRAAENFADTDFRYFRPLPVLSLHWDYLLWGADPRGYHLTNLILHLINMLLVYVLGKALWQAFHPERPDGNIHLPVLSARFFAFAAAFFFLLHPIHSLSIFWISGRTDMICALFYMVTLLLFIRYRQSGQWGWQAAGLISFILALLSKEMAASLPPVLLALAAIFGNAAGRVRFARALRQSAPYWLMLGGYVLFRLSIIGRDVLGNADHRLTGPLQVAKNLVVYLGLLAVPGGHIAIGNVLKAHPLLFAGLTLAGLFLLGLAFRRLKTSPPLLFLLLFVLLTLLPVIRLVMRWYLYIPSLGFCLALGYLLPQLAARQSRSRQVAVAAMLGTGLVYAGFLWQAQMDWRQAGELSRNYTGKLAAAIAGQPGTDFYVLNVPGEVAEVPVAMYGLQAFIRFRLANEFADQRPVILRRVAYLSLGNPGELDRQDVRETGQGRYMLSTGGANACYFFPDMAHQRGRWHPGAEIAGDGFRGEIMAVNPRGEVVQLTVVLSDPRTPVLVYRAGQIAVEGPRQ